MGITASFTAREVQTYIREQVARQEEKIKVRLIKIGNKYVIDARKKATDAVRVGGKLVHPQGPRTKVNADSPSFIDHTGNLRSAIGFVLIKDGTQVHANFETARKGTDKEQGRREGIAIANSLASEYMRGFVLVVVAGMEYAAAVESVGFDVITGSSIEAKNSLQRYFTAR